MTRGRVTPRRTDVHRSDPASPPTAEEDRTWTRPFWPCGSRDSSLSAVALWQHGYRGIIAPHLETGDALQVLVDRLIAFGLAMVWVWRYACAAGRNPWPWIALTLVAGSFGPLGYLLTRPGRVAALVPGRA